MFAEPAGRRRRRRRWRRQPRGQLQHQSLLPGSTAPGTDRRPPAAPPPCGRAPRWRGRGCRTVAGAGRRAPRRRPPRRTRQPRSPSVRGRNRAVAELIRREPPTPSARFARYTPPGRSTRAILGQELHTGPGAGAAPRTRRPAPRRPGCRGARRPGRAARRRRGRPGRSPLGGQPERTSSTRAPSSPLPAAPNRDGLLRHSGNVHAPPPRCRTCSGPVAAAPAGRAGGRSGGRTRIRGGSDRRGRRKTARCRPPATSRPGGGREGDELGAAMVPWASTTAGMRSSGPSRRHGPHLPGRCHPRHLLAWSGWGRGIAGKLRSCNEVAGTWLSW